MLFRVTVQKGRVTRAEPAPDGTVLTDAQQALVRARVAATASAASRSWRPCAQRPFNAVVLPSELAGGNASVYLLTPQEAADVVPMGGHFLVTVRTDDSIAEARPFSRSCLALQVPATTGAGTPVGAVVSHLLDPTPTEVHVFTSLVLGKPLYVLTPDRLVWKVQGDRVSATEARP